MGILKEVLEIYEEKTLPCKTCEKRECNRNRNPNLGEDKRTAWQRVADKEMWELHGCPYKSGRL